MGAGIMLDKHILFNSCVFIFQTRSRKKRCILVIFLLVVITIVALIIWLASK